MIAKWPLFIPGLAVGPYTICLLYGFMAVGLRSPVSAAIVTPAAILESPV